MEQEKTFAHFIKYNNTVPIVLGILFLSTSATLAASPEVRDSIYEAESTVMSVDTTYLLAVDLDDYPFAIRITSVTEDDIAFYVAYEFDTIEIADSVWQDVTRIETLQVHKEALKGDFETYVEFQLAQVRDSALERLKETQNYQRTLGASQKTVATAYKGLIGKFREPDEMIVPQYESKISKNSDLYIKNPQPLVTWDANAEPSSGGDTSSRDKCPDMPGTQFTEGECVPWSPPGGGGEGEPPPEEPPAEEPPPEEPPAEEPPAEEPPAEEPPAEEPPAQDPPGEGGGEEGGGEGGGA